MKTPRYKIGDILCGSNGEWMGEVIQIKVEQTFSDIRELIDNDGNSQIFYVVRANGVETLILEENALKLIYLVDVAVHLSHIDYKLDIL